MSFLIRVWKKYVMEITKHDPETSILKDRRNGEANMNFESSTTQAARQTIPGMSRDERIFDIIRKTRVDLGFAGFPHPRKSLLIGILTNATPGVANSPFTPLHPNIRIMLDENTRGRISLVNIPGLFKRVRDNGAVLFAIRLDRRVCHGQSFVGG
jgi:GTP-binding protein